MSEIILVIPSTAVNVSQPVTSAFCTVSANKSGVSDTIANENRCSTNL